MAPERRVAASPSVIRSTQTVASDSSAIRPTQTVRSATSATRPTQTPYSTILNRQQAERLPQQQPIKQEVDRLHPEQSGLGFDTAQRLGAPSSATVSCTASPLLPHEQAAAAATLWEQLRRLHLASSHMEPSQNPGGPPPTGPPLREPGASAAAPAAASDPSMDELDRQIAALQRQKHLKAQSAADQENARRKQALLDRHAEQQRLLHQQQAITLDSGLVEPHFTVTVDGPQMSPRSTPTPTGRVTLQSSERQSNLAARNIYTYFGKPHDQHQRFDSGSDSDAPSTPVFRSSGAGTPPISGIDKTTPPFPTPAMPATTTARTELAYSERTDSLRCGQGWPGSQALSTTLPPAIHPPLDEQCAASPVALETPVGFGQSLENSAEPALADIAHAPSNPASSSSTSPSAQQRTRDLFTSSTVVPEVLTTPISMGPWDESPSKEQASSLQGPVVWPSAENSKEPSRM